MNVLEENYKQPVVNSGGYFLGPDTEVSIFNSLSNFEEGRELKSLIHRGINLIFIFSMSYPCEGVADFFSGSNFAMMEAHHELQASYRITKFGFFKQGLMSLRSCWELGLLSTYWAIVGKDERAFKSWLRGREKTPSLKEIQRELLNNLNICAFNQKQPITEFFDKLKRLHDYVHTKGIHYSTFGQSHRMIWGKESNESLFEKWCQFFQECIQTITILHLLRFPIASLNYDFIKKFGSYDKAPFCGGLFGDYQEDFIRFLGKEKLGFIQKIARNDDETVALLEWLDSHPDLSQEEIDMIFAQQEKNGKK